MVLDYGIYVYFSFFVDQNIYTKYLNGFYPPPPQ